MPGPYVFRTYIPVAERRTRGQSLLARLLRTEKRRAAPIVIDGRAIAHTFWGQSWCRNLERYSDFASRLPRGRNYARNGSILDLRILPGRVTAYVAGHDLYTVDVSIAPLPTRRWQRVVSASRSNIGSVIDLLRGELSAKVMTALTDAKRGLFPEPREIDMQCSCPDSAVMCKHVAATLYGVGARLDERPELFFTLRQVDHAELIASAHATDALVTIRGNGRANGPRVATKTLENIFGIDIAADVTEPAARPSPAPRRARAVLERRQRRDAASKQRRTTI